MRRYRILWLIGIIEILIGGITLCAVLVSSLTSSDVKTPNVLSFVIVASLISTSLGIGILQFNRTAYNLLLYFSSVILLSKLLIFLNIIQLNGDLETAISPSLKNLASVLYHGAIILYLKRISIRNLFNNEISLVNLKRPFKEATLE